MNLLFEKGFMALFLMWSGLVVFGLILLIIEIKDWKDENKFND